MAEISTLKESEDICFGSHSWMIAKKKNFFFFLNPLWLSNHRNCESHWNLLQKPAVMIFFKLPEFYMVTVSSVCYSWHLEWVEDKEKICKEKICKSVQVQICTWTSRIMIIFPRNNKLYLLQITNKDMRKHSFGSKGSPCPTWLPFTPICILDATYKKCL